MELIFLPLGVQLELAIYGAKKIFVRLLKTGNDSLCEIEELFYFDVFWKIIFKKVLTKWKIFGNMRIRKGKLPDGIVQKVENSRCSLFPKERALFPSLF